MKPNTKFQVHGHRGCRGLYPENTITAFEHAHSLGVDAIELDIVISKDKQVIVSHEPYFSHKFSTDPKGKPVRKYNELKHNLYQMTVEEIQRYDVGLRRHPDFPKQKLVASYKPTLVQAIRHIDSLRKKEGKQPMHYSIEVKRKKRWDNRFAPAAKEYASIVLATIKKLRIASRMSLLCFDIEFLEEVHAQSPKIELVYLVDNLLSVSRNMNRLSFTPDVYGPKYSLVNKKTVDYCNAHGIDIVCWTVNTLKDAKRLSRLGVNGLTSDYPDKLIDFRSKN